jgi:hypothetical protein
MPWIATNRGLTFPLWRDRKEGVTMRAYCIFTACALVAVFPCTVHAQATLPWEKGSFQIGGFITSSDTEMRVDSTGGGAGAVVNVEDALGVKGEKNTYRIDTFYRFGETRRHQVDLHYFDSRRSGDRVVDDTIQIGDATFPVGAQVSTQFDLKFINLDYSYAFFQDDRVRLAVAGGVHSTGVHYKVSSPGLGLFEDQSYTAPLPVAGLRGEVAVTERWRLKAALDLFYLKYDRYTGTLADSTLAVEYLPFKHMGVGLGLNSLRMRVEAEGEDGGPKLNSELKFNFTGLLLYGKFFF